MSVTDFKVIVGVLTIVALLIGLPLTIGYAAGAGWGWLAFTLACLLFAKVYQAQAEEKAKQED